MARGKTPNKTRKRRKFRPGTRTKMDARKLIKSIKPIIQLAPIARMSRQAFSVACPDKESQVQDGVFDLIRTVIESWAHATCTHVSGILSDFDMKTVQGKHILRVIKIQNTVVDHSDSQSRVPYVPTGKRHNSKPEKIGSENIPQKALRKLAIRAGIAVVGNSYYPVMRACIQTVVDRISRDALALTEYRGRKTVTRGDILEACQRNNIKIYG